LQPYVQVKTTRPQVNIKYLWHS